MASKVEQQYKLLNAELMDQVQKQRMEIGAYRKQLIALKHENMELREAQILQNACQRKDHIAIIRSLMRRLDIDADCLADRTVTEERSPSFVANRHSQQRRSSRDICQEMRRSSALAFSPKTISPTRRRDIEMPKEAPILTQHTPPPRRVAELADEGSSEEEQESTTATEGEEQPTEEGVQRQSDERLLPEGSPSTEGEEQPTEEAVERQTDERLFSIIEDSDEETSTYSSSSSSPICCDSTVEEKTPSRRVLRSVDPNVVPVLGAVTMTRGKSKLIKSLAIEKDNSAEEQPSIQIPRLLLTSPGQSLAQSLLSSVSVSRVDASLLSPRRSLFEGAMRKSGTHTSTPIANKASPQQTTTKKGEGCASTSVSCKSSVRFRSPVLEPKKSDSERDMSTSCLSSSGRPSRRCRPTQLAEPSLRSKMRNSSVGKKK